MHSVLANSSGHQRSAARRRSAATRTSATLMRPRCAGREESRLMHRPLLPMVVLSIAVWAGSAAAQSAPPAASSTTPATRSAAPDAGKATADAAMGGPATAPEVPRKLVEIYR